MNTKDVAEIVWSSIKNGDYPNSLLGKLTFEEGYQTQMLILKRRIEEGEKQAGWKIGLTADVLRNMFNMNSPVFGYLMESGRFSTGHAFQFNDIVNPCIESELYITINKQLKGPEITKKDVLNAVESIAPAFEIVSMRGSMAEDLPLALANNVSQWGYVTGTEIAPYPQNLDLGEIVAEVTSNNTEISQGRGADVIDNQLESIAWLANQLADYNMALEPGQCIMTGSFTKPLPINKNDQWETKFTSLGQVSASFN